MKHNILFLLLFCAFAMPAQLFENICVKAGGGLSNQNKSPELSTDKYDAIAGLVFGIEPEILRFSASKKMALSLDVLFVQKGSTNTSYINTFDPNGQLMSTGSMSIPCKLYNISFAPNYKFEFPKLFYLKAGPRIDFNAGHSFSQLPPNIPAPEDSYSFEKLCFGFSYAFGLVLGQGDFRLMAELMGQNDLSESAQNSSTGQTYTNNLYSLNIGMVYMLK